MCIHRSSCATVTLKTQRYQNRLWVTQRLKFSSSQVELFTSSFHQSRSSNWSTSHFHFFHLKLYRRRQQQQHQRRRRRRQQRQRRQQQQQQQQEQQHQQLDITKWRTVKTFQRKIFLKSWSMPGNVAVTLSSRFTLLKTSGGFVRRFIIEGWTLRLVAVNKSIILGCANS